jgi:hypothetical protein
MREASTYLRPESRVMADKCQQNGEPKARIDNDEEEGKS